MNKLASILFLSMILFFGCLDGESNDEEEIKKVVYDNIEALNAEDLEAAMDTVHPEIKGYEVTKEVTEYMFETYDLYYELSEFKIIELSETEAQVEVVQTSKKISGPEYTDNKVTAIHKLKKYNGEWRIYATKIKNIEYLN